MFFARVLLLPRKTSPLYKIGKFRHLLAYIGRFVFPIREPGRLYQNRESPGEIGRLERSAINKCISLYALCVLFSLSLAFFRQKGGERVMCQIFTVNLTIKYFLIHLIVIDNCIFSNTSYCNIYLCQILMYSNVTFLYLLYLYVIEVLLISIVI